MSHPSSSSHDRSSRSESTDLVDDTWVRGIFYVYVIELGETDELRRKVGNIKKFRKRQNKNFKLGNRCFYVGHSAKKPEERFRQHRAGKKANTYARSYGFHLVPEYYEHHNPIRTESRSVAEELEERVARELCDEGYGVWWN